MQVFSLLLAAAVHDLAHPGVTNDFLVRTCHALAARFGGRGGGVNERHHVASFLGLLDDPATDAFAGLGEQDQQRVCFHDFSRASYKALVGCLPSRCGFHNQLTGLLRHCTVSANEADGGTSAGVHESRPTDCCRPQDPWQLSTHPVAALAPAQARQFVQQAVMSTDMGSHQELVDQLAASRAERPDIGARSGDPGARALLLQFLLHAADLCNPCRPPPLGTAWGERVCGEFLAQVRAAACFDPRV